jgi:hypothetical protein
VLPRFSHWHGSAEAGEAPLTFTLEKIMGTGMMVRSFCFAVTLLVSSMAAAQTTALKTDISDKTLRTLKTLAWQSLPAKIIQSDNRVVEIDKSNPANIIIPDADAREVIRVAHLTARAHKCDLQDLVLANRNALLLRAQKTGRWSESQLQYINTLHLFTVQLLVGKVELVDTEKAKTDFDPKAAPMPQDSTKQCNDQEKQDITSAVEANGKLLGKS